MLLVGDNMNRWALFLAAAVTASFLVGCQSNSTTSQTSRPDTKYTATLASMGLSVANPVQHEGVTVVPIVSNKTQKTTSEFILLDEAQKRGWIVIEEGDMGFNGVRVKNNGDKPVLLLAGDVVIGGHQDRVIAHDTIIQPGETKAIEVFCVEEERSTGPTDRFQASTLPAPYKVRRSAVFSEDQSAVWGSVDSFNSAASAAPMTKTVQGGLNSEKVQQFVAKNHESLVDKLVSIPNAVGYVVIVRGKPDSAELFGSNQMLKTAGARLLKGLQVQAATDVSLGQKPDISEVEKFLANAITGSRKSAREPSSQPFGNTRTYARQRTSQTLNEGRFNVMKSEAKHGVELFDSAKPGSTIQFVHGSYQAKP